MEMVKYWDAIKYSSGYFKFSVMLQMCIRPWNHPHTSRSTIYDLKPKEGVKSEYSTSTDPRNGARDLFIRGHFLWPSCTFFPSEQYWKNISNNPFSLYDLHKLSFCPLVHGSSVCIPPGRHDSFACSQLDLDLARLISWGMLSPNRQRAEGPGRQLGRWQQWFLDQK